MTEALKRDRVRDQLATAARGAVGASATTPVEICDQCVKGVEADWVFIVKSTPEGLRVCGCGFPELDARVDPGVALVELLRAKRGPESGSPPRAVRGCAACRWRGCSGCSPRGARRKTRLVRRLRPRGRHG